MTVRQHIVENRTINTDAHKPIQMGHIRYQDNRRQSMIPTPETDAYQTKTGKHADTQTKHGHCSQFHVNYSDAVNI